MFVVRWHREGRRGKWVSGGRWETVGGRFQKGFGFFFFFFSDVKSAAVLRRCRVGDRSVGFGAGCCRISSNGPPLLPFLSF